VSSRWLVLAFAVSCVSACKQPETPCEQASAEVRQTLQECGVTFHEYPDGLGSPCTEQLRGIYDCYLECYQEASCEAILAEDQTGYEVFHDCRESCLPW
jgi:hypothetical protein